MAKKRKRVWVNPNQIQNLSSKTIQVRISSFEKGLEIYNDMKIIRITSASYNLLVMAGYHPLIGEIDGNISLISESQEIELPNINAFYCFRNNVLKILVRETTNVI